MGACCQLRFCERVDFFHEARLVAGCGVPFKNVFLDGLVKLFADHADDLSCLFDVFSVKQLTSLHAQGMNFSLNDLVAFRAFLALAQGFFSIS